MDPLRQEFNTLAADWSIRITPLLTLLILDDIARRETRRRKRSERLDRQFNALSLTQSREQYQRQVQAPQPQYRLTSPNF